MEVKSNIYDNCRSQKRQVLLLIKAILFCVHWHLRKHSHQLIILYEKVKLA